MEHLRSARAQILCPSLLVVSMRQAGRTCMTRRRDVALLQSLESSRQRMMYSRCSILLRTMFSTCLALCCSAALRRPGAAEINPATTCMCQNVQRGHLGMASKPATLCLLGALLLQGCVA